MSANRIVTCFCWAPDGLGAPAGSDGFPGVSSEVPQLAQNRAAGRLATQQELQIFSILVPQLSQYCLGSARSPQCGQAICVSVRDRSAEPSGGRVIDDMRTDPASLRPGLPPPDASRADPAARQLVLRLGHDLAAMNFLAHAADQPAFLIFPVCASGCSAWTGEAEYALGLRPDGVAHVLRQRDGRGDIRHHPARPDETNDQRVRRSTRCAGAKILLGHLGLDHRIPAS